MPNNKSTYLETAVLNVVLRGGVLTAPTTVYVGLYTAMSSDRSVGGTEVSTSGTAYVRQPISFAVPTYAMDGSASSASTSTVTFPTATAIWGTIVGFGLYDAVSSGTLLYFGTLSSSQTVNQFDQIVFDIGAIVVSES